MNGTTMGKRKRHPRERDRKITPTPILPTSSPPNWMRCVSLASASSENLAPVTCESSGRIVVPA